jgi:hypothetical protein
MKSLIVNCDSSGLAADVVLRTAWGFGDVIGAQIVRARGQDTSPMISDLHLAISVSSHV